MTQSSSKRKNTGKRAANLRKCAKDGATWAKLFHGDPTIKDLACELNQRFPVLSDRYWAFQMGALNFINNSLSQTNA